MKKHYRYQATLPVIQINLGTSFHYKASGSKRSLVEKADSFQYVPLMQNLEWILQNKEVCDEVSEMKLFFILIFENS